MGKTCGSKAFMTLCKMGHPRKRPGLHTWSAPTRPDFCRSATLKTPRFVANTQVWPHCLLRSKLSLKWSTFLFSGILNFFQKRARVWRFWCKWKQQWSGVWARGFRWRDSTTTQPSWSFLLSLRPWMSVSRIEDFKALEYRWPMGRFLRT